MERADVAIVGGGPAGSSAAAAAAAAGADTVLVEKGVPRADREGLGPDSTDAAGMLDYWVDLMDFEPDEIPDELILSELEGADFVGPNASVRLDDTGIESSYDGFGFTFHRARFDDWLHDRARDRGADFRVGTSVREVEPRAVAGDGAGAGAVGGGPTAGAGGPDPAGGHRLTLADGSEILADAVILADGPQRTVTTGVLDELLDGAAASDRLAPTETNHIAYQEHRRMPPELFESGRIKFWWGVIPGHTAYPWVFPNDDGVARIGLTMPIGMDRDAFDADEYALLREDDERIPDGAEYVRRLLEYVYPDYDVEDFPLVEDRGKHDGTETYPISSTHPIESPGEAGVAVVGGAMGATSAFHEGGDHVAVRTGKIAGRLAAEGRLDRYNDAWREAIGDEVLRNAAMASVVREYDPDDWDRTFAAADRMVNTDGPLWRQAAAARLTGLRLFVDYKLAKRRFRDGGYLQIRRDDYATSR